MKAPQIILSMCLLIKFMIDLPMNGKPARFDSFRHGVELLIIFALLWWGGFYG